MTECYCIEFIILISYFPFTPYFVDVATSFTLTLPSSSSISTDTNIVATITALDHFSNIAKGDTSRKVVVARGSSSGSPVFVDTVSGLNQVTLVNGVASFTIRVTLVQTVTFTLYDQTGTTVIVAAQDLAVPNGVATKAVLLQPASAIAGAFVTVRVQLQDQNSNLAVNTTASIRYAVSQNATIIGSSTVSITNGAGQATITDLVAETTVISLSSPSISVTSSSTTSLTFSPGLIFIYFLFIALIDICFLPPLFDRRTGLFFSSSQLDISYCGQLRHSDCQRT